MAITWNWRQDFGTIHFKNGKIFHLFGGENSLAVLLYLYHNKTIDKDMFVFEKYWSDEESLERDLGLIENYDEKIENMYEDEIDHIELNTFYTELKVYRIAFLFSKAKFKVILYYSEGDKN
ncbi:MAG: hypothetical protein K5765_06370 [Clostridia bacterium]|nr:hypothetical protein [Clostridia bacterium]